LPFARLLGPALARPVVGLVVVDQINASKGLGYMMFRAQQYASPT
jgi:ABC-type nitrate/sulfonate/bicarbonate transport system permease component